MRAAVADLRGEVEDRDVVEALAPAAHVPDPAVGEPNLDPPAGARGQRERPAPVAALAQQGRAAAARRGSGHALDDHPQAAPAQHLVALLEDDLGTRARAGGRLCRRRGVPRGVEHAAVGEPGGAAVVGLEDLEAARGAPDRTHAPTLEDHGRARIERALVKRDEPGAREARPAESAPEARRRDARRDGEQPAVDRRNGAPVGRSVDIVLPHVLLRPHPGEGLDRARARRDDEQTAARGAAPPAPERQPLTGERGLEQRPLPRDRPRRRARREHAHAPFDPAPDPHFPQQHAVRVGVDAYRQPATECGTHGSAQRERAGGRPAVELDPLHVAEVVGHDRRHDTLRCTELDVGAQIGGRRRHGQQRPCRPACPEHRDHPHAAARGRARDHHLVAGQRDVVGPWGVAQRDRVGARRRRGQQGSREHAAQEPPHTQERRASSASVWPPPRNG
ncbi:MAG TPA: hypothetical protein VKB28_10445 [Solirubrobacteraceae bacterium]|nr:hypothetical protein [Solirubrobacteraceae bacterium]